MDVRPCFQWNLYIFLPGLITTLMELFKHQNPAQNIYFAIKVHRQAGEMEQINPFSVRYWNTQQPNFG